MYPGQPLSKIKRMEIGLAVIGTMAAVIGAIFEYPSFVGWLNSRRSEPPLPGPFSPTETTIPTHPPPPTAVSLPDWVVDARDIPMVLITTGIFSMGSDLNQDELPVHSVLLENFYIDQYEVTNGHYADCVDAGVCGPPIFTSSQTRPYYWGNAIYGNFPVIYVTWEMARVYCEDWRGARLPTEAEWELAAHGTEGGIYPWGNDIDCSQANYTQMGSACVGDTSEVGLYELGQSPFKVFDMAGNVEEWVADWYNEQYYNILPDGVQNPQGPLTGEDRVVRGGSWQDSQYAVRSANRDWADPNAADAFTGFRCALSP